MAPIVTTTCLDSNKMQDKTNQEIPRVKENENLEDEEAEGWQDIIGNGQLKRKIIRHGKAWTKPSKGDICKINIEGYLENSRQVDKYDNYEIFVGEGDVIQGIDLTLVLMNVGELAQVKIHPRFAYGKLGRKSDVPPNSSIIYTVELLEVKNFDITQMNLSERNEKGCMKRIRGNWWYKRKDYYHALLCYQKALAFHSMENLLNEDRPTEAERKELLHLSLLARNNIVITQMALKRFDDALETVNHVIADDPENRKAIYRKAKILQEIGDLRDAYDLYLELIATQKNVNDSTESLIKHELRTLGATIIENTTKEKKLYRKMLGIRDPILDLVNVSDYAPDYTPNKEMEMNKKIMWSLAAGASAVIFSVLIHKFVL